MSEKIRQEQIQAALNDYVTKELINAICTDPNCIQWNEELNLYAVPITVHNQALRKYEIKNVNFSLGVLDAELTKASEELPRAARLYNEMKERLDRAEKTKAAVIAFQKSLLPESL